MQLAWKIYRGTLKNGTLVAEVRVPLSAVVSVGLSPYALAAQPVP
jgi:hypothetical protein